MTAYENGPPPGAASSATENQFTGSVIDQEWQAQKKARAIAELAKLSIKLPDTGNDDPINLSPKKITELRNTFAIKEVFADDFEHLVGTGLLGDHKPLTEADREHFKKVEKYKADLLAMDQAKREIADDEDEEITFVFTNSSARRRRPQLRWMIDGLVHDGPGVGILFGPEQSYKSFIVAHLAMSLTNKADDWFGQAIGQADQPRHALIVLMEGAEAYQDRLDSLMIAHASWTDGGIVTMENQAVDVSSQARMAALTSGIHAHTIDGEPFRPALIVVDTQGLAMGETDEYNRPAMRQVYKNARALAVEFGCFVLMVTHPGNTNQHRPAGASSQAQDADVMFRAYRDGTIEVTKAKHSGLRGKKFTHVQEAHGDSLAIRWTGDASIGTQALEHFKAHRERADRIVDAVRKLTEKKPRGVSKSDVCTAVGGNKRDVLTVIDDLLDNGRLRDLSPTPTRSLLITDESIDATV